MRVEYLSLDSSNRLPTFLRNGIVSVGKFDGVHLGHASILRRMKQLSTESGRASVAITFDYSPASILRPQNAPPSLCTFQRKADLMGDFQLDALALVHTDANLLELSAEEFFRDFLIKKMAVHTIIEGESFEFGRNRGGDVSVLRDLCEKNSVQCEILEPVIEQGKIVSSSRIRKLIETGKIEQANQLLTRPYRISGQVVPGRQRGRTLGYPTINLDHIPTLYPENGIYACIARLGDGEIYPASTCIGENVTFGEERRKVEAHLIGFSGDLYQRTVHLEFHARLRDLEKFETRDALIEQIRRDVDKSRELFRREV